MLAKLGAVFFNEDRLPKYKHLGYILILFGIFAAMAFPYLAEETYIIEKFFKNSGMLNNQLTSTFFNDCQERYFKTKNEHIQKDNDLYFSNQIFSNDPANLDRIYSKSFPAPRGDKKKFIMFNLIYPKISYNIEAYQKANAIWYTIMRFLSNKDNVVWLAKEVQINYVPAHLFYDDFKDTYVKLTDGRYNKLVQMGEKIDAIVNIDLNQFDLDHFSKFILKINGIHSENIDMDYFKVIIDNLSESKAFSTNDEVFSSSFKKTLKDFLNSIGRILSNILKLPGAQDQKSAYTSRYLYFLENIADNYFMINNKINLNHMFISNNFDSILIKVEPKIKPIETNSARKKAYNFAASIERIIKIISKNEIDIFRGQYHYVLTSYRFFVGYNFLILPILLIIKTFYELLTVVYNTDYKEIGKRIDPSKILSILLLTFVIIIGMLLHIGDIGQIFNIKKNVILFYYLMIACFVISAIAVLSLKMNEQEIIFVDNLIRFFLALNCFNFIFVNIGIGIVLSVVILPTEALIISLRERGKQFVQIFIFGVGIYIIYSSNELINSMVENWIEFGSNVYPILSITFALFIFRFVVVILMVLRKKEESKIEKVDDEKKNN